MTEERTADVQYLDLVHDDPEEYEGRHVVVDGAEYVIGRWVGEGEERIVHELTNQRSGCSLHLIKILRDQIGGAAASRGASEATANLRDLLRGAEYVRVANEAQLVFDHNGVFELQEAASGDAETGSARSAAAAGRWDECVSLCDRILATTPDHAEALHLTALAAVKRNDPQTAADLEARAIEIEPNIRGFRQIWLESAAEIGAVHYFIDGFAEFKAKWPTDDVVDKLAAQIYLHLGRPADAASLRVRNFDAALLKQIQNETRASRRATTLAAAAFDALMVGRFAKVRRRLRAAYKKYPKDPRIAFNWGLALLRDGDAQGAYDVLVPITLLVDRGFQHLSIGSVAFALALMGEDTNAAGLLALAVQQLENKGPLVFPDLPMWALWATDDQAISDPNRSARLVQDLISRLGTDAPPELHRLAAAYPTTTEP